MDLAFARFEEFFRILGVIAELVGYGKHFHTHGIGARFACFLDHCFDDVILAFQEHLKGAFDDRCAFTNWRGRPGRLRRPGFGNGSCNVLSIGAYQFAGRL